MNSALVLQNVSKNYEDFQLQNINLTLPSGCIMGFIGENGAGKSTTIKLILDLIHHDSGSITILGKDNITELELIKEHIGVVMDESCFPENLSSNDISRIMKNIYTTWSDTTFQSYMSKFSLPSKKAIKDYSKGMKMKLSIAVALSHDSKLLILDEATSGLDPIIREEILDVFLDFIQDESHSIFMASHIISDLEKVCDYITFIHKGEIIFTENKDELLEKYGILKCTFEELEAIDSSAIIGFRKSQFSAEALVLRNEVPSHFIIDRPTIEDIMVFYVKENAQ